MTKEFREAVDRQDSEVGGVVLQLKKLFATLKSGHTASTQELTHTLCIRNVFEQQDAAEYFQRILSSVSRELSTLYRGAVRNTTTCQQGCHDTSEEECPFMVLPLSIDAPSDHHIYRVEDGWKAFFKPSVLDGDNQMYCDICEQKTDTEMRCEIKEYPKILTLQLKRFAFDYSWMTYVKNDCEADIPRTLTIEKYKYELYAITNHSGTYTGGHYNALIRSYEDHSWYCFDDTNVGKISDEWLLMYQPNPHYNPPKIRSRNAYLLMYEREDFPGPDSPVTPVTPETPVAPVTHVTPVMPVTLVQGSSITSPSDPQERQLTATQQSSNCQNLAAPVIRTQKGSQKHRRHRRSKKRRRRRRHRRHRGQRV
ncbi:ubiquitin carboxyl-terminal hydrolase 47 [Megalops cyprinoides]|uniref:ubiquitin carboxyl-terminal hydrolase 47 n=1 Tax=Megalops cyprinoides TaxID=118141 RepID=UPI00186451C8|nr:ubiquitin carboxyl-terminal hydrolase 47 [Megalops cyprinoides]